MAKTPPPTYHRRSMAMRLQRANCLTFACAATFSLFAAMDARAANDAPTAKQRLRRHGLTPVGQVWIVEDEATLRRELQEFDGVERRLREATDAASAQLRQNEAIRQWLVVLEKAESESKKRRFPPPSGTSAAVTRHAEAGKLESTMPDVTGVGDESPLQTAMIQLVTARSAAAIALLSIDQHAESLSDQYAELATDEGVLTALRELGDAARLGPLRSYRARPDRVEAVAQRVFADPMPIFLECGHERLGIVLDDRVAVTATIDRGNGPPLLTATVAESLELSPSENATRRITVDKRELTVRAARLGVLRIGGVIAKDVEALILPPEAESLGNHIFEMVTPHRRLVTNPAKMEATFERVP